VLAFPPGARLRAQTLAQAGVRSEPPHGQAQRVVEVEHVERHGDRAAVRVRFQIVDRRVPPPRAGIERRQVRVVRGIDHDGRPAHGERPHPRPRRFQRRRPSQVQGDVRGGDRPIERRVVGRGDAADRAREAQRRDLVVEIEPRIGGACQQEARAGDPRDGSGECLEDLWHAFVRGQAAVYAEDNRIRRQAVLRPKPIARRRDIRLRRAFAERDVFDRAAGPVARDHRGHAARVRRQQARRFDDAAAHGPLVEKDSVDAEGRKFCGRRIHVGMVPGEFGPVVGVALAGEHGLGAGVVHARVVQHGESGETKEVGPDEPMQVRVADLVDGQVVGRSGVSPDEVVGAEDPDDAWLGRLVGGGTRCYVRRVHEHVDRVAARAQNRDQLRRAPGDAAALRRPRRKPRNPHGAL
jgi:hypothetical protein